MNSNKRGATVQLHTSYPSTCQKLANDETNTKIYRRTNQKTTRRRIPNSITTEISRFNSKFTLRQAQAIPIEREKSKVTKQTREKEKKIKSNQMKHHRLPFSGIDDNSFGNSRASSSSKLKNYCISFDIVEN